MPTLLRLVLTTAIAAAGLGAVTPIRPPAIDVHVREGRLTSGDTADSALGNGTAFVLGGSFLSTPSQTYADIVDSLYLEPRDFTGTTQILTTPEGLYPFT